MLILLYYDLIIDLWKIKDGVSKDAYQVFNDTRY